MNLIGKKILFGLALFAFAAALFLAPSAAAGVSLACSPFIFSRRILLDPHEAEGGFFMSEVDGDKVVAGVEKILGDVSRIDGQTKKAFEELQAVKKVCNGHAEALAALQKVDRNIRRESRDAYGDPIERIIENEEYRNFLNKAALNAIGKLPPSEVKALGEDSSPGSTMINDALAGEIYDTLANYGSWNTLGVRPLMTKTTKFPVKTARATASFINTEGDEIPDDTTKAGTSVNCTVKPIASLVNVSLQLIDDGEFDIARDVLEDFTESFNQRLDAGVFQGDGTANATYGGYTGIMNFGTAATSSTGNTTVESLDLEDFLRCLTTVAPTVLGRKSSWWIHPQILARIVAVRDGNGRPLFQTALEAPAPGAIGSILGYPVRLTHAAPSANTAWSKIAAFGDPNAYVVGIRRVFQFEQSDSHKWNTLQRSFRSFGRAGGIGRRADGLAILTLAAS